MHIDLNLLNCFRTVAEKGSLSSASEALHLSQPAISIQIKKLEQSLNRTLFDRHNRGLLLTPFGREVLQYAHRVNELSQQLLNHSQSRSTVPTGKVKIGTYTTASSYLLARPVSDVLGKHKGVGVAYSYLPASEILEQIKDYRLDCGVLTDVPDDSELKIETIFNDELVLAQSAKSKRTKASTIQPKDLATFDFLSYPLRFDLCYKTVEQRFGAHLAKSRVAVESESFDTLKQMLLQGAGVTFIPRYLISKELDRGDLAEISVGNTKLPIRFSFVTKRNSEISPAVAAIRESILSHYKNF